MQIEWNGAVLYFRKTGSGPETLLLFHGFGQDHSVFNSLTDKLSNAYTCYAFDLFFHGKSTWPHHPAPVRQSDWHSMLETFIRKEGITSFSVLGFSIGARLALGALAAFPQMVTNVFLLAPDGIVQNFWFSVATGSRAGQHLFRKFTEHPTLAHSLIRFSVRINLVNPLLGRFAEKQLGTSEQRIKVFKTWMALRTMNFPIEQIEKLLTNNAARMTIVTCANDPVINTNRLKKLLNNVPERTIPHSLDVAHHKLIDEVTANPGTLFRSQNGNPH